MKRLLSLLSLVCLFLAGMSAAELNIYASGLRVNSVDAETNEVSIEYFLNAPATALEFQLLNASSGAVLKTVAITDESDLTKGQHTNVSLGDALHNVLGGTYKWALKATGSEITRTEPEKVKTVGTGTSGGRVVTIDHSYESPYYGNIYFVNGYGVGIYGFDAALTPLFDGGAVASNGWNTASISSPCSATVGEDGLVFISDYNDTNPNVRIFNPGSPTADTKAVFGGTAKGTTGIMVNENGDTIHGSIRYCYPKGTGENTVLYTIDEDYKPGSVTHIFTYNIGNAESPWTAKPSGDGITHAMTSSKWAGTVSNLTFVPSKIEGGWWIAQHRNTDNSSVPALLHIADGTLNYNSSGAFANSTIGLNTQGALAINNDQSIIVTATNNSKFNLLVWDVSWSGKVPTVTAKYTISSGLTASTFGIAIDNADNIYACSPNKPVTVWSLPKEENTCTTPAASSRTITLSTIIDVTHVASVSLDQTSKTVKVGETFTLTPTILPEDATDNTYSWSTTNSSVATIADGVVTAVGVGTADITVTTTDGGKTATCAVTVEAPDPLAGSYKIGGAEADFATLYNAVNYLNNWGISGNTTFLICGNLTETHNIGLVNTSAYTITIKPDADADRTISFTQVADNDGPSGAIVIGVNSEGIGWAGTATQNIVFDGLASAEATHKMTIKNASTFGSTYGPFVIYGAVTNTAIRNCRIISEVSPTCYCITFRNNQPTGSSSKSDDYADGVIIENNYIATPSNAGNGQAIYINGSKATTTGPSNLVIRNNEIVANSRGITLYGLNNIDISNNIIRMNSASGYDCAAIYGLTSSGNINICNNQILSLASGNESTTTAHGLQGIIAGSGGNWLIANNLITGFDAKTDGRKGHLIGIKTGGTPSSIKILHNTLYMPAFNHTMTSALLNAKPVTLLYIAGGSPIVKNNILISEETSCVNSLIRGELNANCTNNVLYSAGGSGVIVDGATACANWDEFCTKYSAQARTSTWQQIELEDNYKPTSTYIDNVNLAVTPLAEVTTDIEGTTRNETKTYAGCYEASNIAAVYSGVSSLTLPATASVERDNTLELTPIVTPAIAANRTQFWSSDNTAVATVDNSGVVTAVAVGTANITVTIDGVTSDPCTVTVYRTDFEVTWEPNGATTTSTAPASNEELWEAFKPAYNTFYSASRSTTIAITAVATFANAKMQEFMTDPASSWKWLGDYMLSVATAQGYNFEPETNVTAEQKWRFCAQAFFNCAEANVYAINAPDFTTAGQIANWLPLWKQANNYLPATMRSTDEMPVIRKGNDFFAGWYDNSSFTGSPVTSVTEDITLYAKWIAPVVLDETTDNTSTLSDNDGKTGNVILKRPFTATDHWYTLVLPFDVTAAQLEEAFGAGTEVAVLQETYWKNDAHTDLFLRFAPQANINAGEPCLFKPAQVIDEQVVFHGVTIDNQTPSLTSDVVDMIGMYSPTDVTVNEVNYYLGNTNLLHLYVDAYKNTKGFRAYFHFDSPLPAHASARVIFHKDVVTDIEPVTDNPSPVTEKVLRNGQLIIIRDGKEYNAQGQLVR